MRSAMPRDPEDQEAPAAPSDDGGNTWTRPLLLGGLGGFVLGALVTAGGIAAFFLDSPGGDDRFETALAECDVDGAEGAELLDDGEGLSLRTLGEENLTGLGFAELECVLAEVEAPEAAQSQMETTRALDGRQTAEWADISASWTYHPRRGLDLVLTLE
jgi:hypothetical protein